MLLGNKKSGIITDKPVSGISLVGRAQVRLILPDQLSIQNEIVYTRTSSKPETVLYTIIGILMTIRTRVYLTLNGVLFLIKGEST